MQHEIYEYSKWSTPRSSSRVLRYIRGTTDNGVCFKTNEGDDSGGYVDSDWDGSIDM